MTVGHAPNCSPGGNPGKEREGLEGRQERPWNYVESCFGTWDGQRIFLSNFEHIPRNGLSCFSYFKIAFSWGSS